MVEEGVLLVVSLVGMGFAMFGVWDAYHDMEVLGLRNGRRIVAKANLRAQAVRAIKLALFAFVAMVSMSAERPLTTGVRALIVWSLVSIAILATMDAILDRFSRRRILNHYRGSVPDNPQK